MIQIGQRLSVSLVPKNEAEYPEIVEVEIMKQLPLKHKNVYIAKLLTQTHQDFGYHVAQLLVVNVTYEEDKMFAFCQEALQKE